MFLGLIFLNANCASLPPVLPLNSQIKKDLGTDSMQAMVAEEYGKPSEVLKMKTVKIPGVGPDQVLIKVKFAALNPMEHHIMTGNFFARMDQGLFSPSNTVFGADLSGVVVAVGANVTHVKKGDDVFAYSQFDAFAQYAKVKSTGVWKKPKNISFETAAAFPLAGVTALYGLQKKGKIKKGDKVLINGASGGVGTFAVQLAKSFGAEVTGVSSLPNHELVKGLGADKMIDYKKVDFTVQPEKYDLILDLVGNYSAGSLRDALKPNGRAVVIGYSGFSTIFHIIMLNSVTGLFSDKEVSMALAEIKQADLYFFAKQAEEGKLKSVIDKVFNFEELPKAMDYLGTHRAKGKVLIKIN